MNTSLVDSFLNVQSPNAIWHVNGEWTVNAPVESFALLSGSFNPLHVGHRQLSEVAEQNLELPVYYELSIKNVDKPQLDRDELLRRVEQFDRPILVTRAASFLDKAAVVPGATFVIGADTAIRLFDLKYYSNSEMVFKAAMNSLRGSGCRFLIAGRFVGSEFAQLSSMNVPLDYPELFVELPEHLFRIDVSSTELRRRENLME